MATQSTDILIADALGRIAQAAEQVQADTNITFWINIGTLVVLTGTMMFIAWQVREMKKSTENANKANKDAIEADRLNNRHRATIDIIRHTQCDPAHCERRIAFLTLREAEGGIAALTQHANKDHPDAATVRENMNHYELMAIGISMNILDEEMYKRYYRSTVISDWQACEPFVTHLRASENNNNFYAEFEVLAKKWMDGGRGNQNG